LLMTSRDDLPLEQAAERHHAEEYTYFLDDDLADADALRAQIANILAAQAGRRQRRPGVLGPKPGACAESAPSSSPWPGDGCRSCSAAPQARARASSPGILSTPRSGREGRFVSVDLSTMPKDLVTAHLFGAARGSYTGAVADRKGAFEEASGGTLFLDEIGNLAEDVQKMLLTVLQEGVVTRLGDMKERASRREVGRRDPRRSTGARAPGVVFAPIFTCASTRRVRSRFRPFVSAWAI
jgi:hypothetical protein